MADLAITAANVQPGTNAPMSSGSDVFGEAVTQGQAVYRKAADNKIYKAKASITAAEAKSVGISLVAGAAGQPAFFQAGGTITIGATTAAGTIYCVSAANAGGVCPWGDLAATNIVTILGVGDGSGGLVMSINPTGIAHA